MWKKIIQSFDMKSNDNSDITRRKFPRRSLDTCAISVNGITSPIRDWSQSGALFQADGRQFALGGMVDVVMKFRMSDRIMEIPLRGRITRAGSTQVAVEFLNVSAEIKAAFNRVIDDALSREFAQTQVG